MKKIFYLIFSFVFLFIGGGLVASNSFASADSGAGEIVINSASEFASKFANEASAFDNTNVVVKLNKDIDFDGVDTSTMYDTLKTFKGTFDGNGFCIKNITLKSGSAYYGIIPYAKDATIQNLKIEGNVSFEFNQGLTDIYAGVLVGRGENVEIRNCELDNTSTDAKIVLPVDANLNFGVLAGKLIGNPNASNQIEPANVYNCLNYYDVEVAINKYSNIAIGGLVGVAEKCFIQNNINLGDIIYSKTTTSTNLNKQAVGGLVGVINGNGLNIRNDCFGGEIKSSGDVSGLGAYVGAIFGRESGNAVVASNVNFAYYTQAILKPSGDEYVGVSDYVKSVATINKDFLSDDEKFDRSLVLWNFDRVWMVAESKLRIQNFQTFHFGFQETLDRNQVLESESAQLNIADGNAKFGKPIEITIFIKPEFRGFYYVNQQSPFILLNHNQFNGDFQLEEIEGGYKILLEANATTAGNYSFIVSQRVYNCEVSISEDAKLNSQGGVYVKKKGSNVEVDPKEKFSILFAHNTDEQEIAAKGQGIYSFDHWKLYYKDSEGNFVETTTPTFTQSGNDKVVVDFGTAPFDQEFKLEAYFTDEESIKLELNGINDNIVSVLMAKEPYTGGAVQFSPNEVALFEITVQKGYVLDNVSIEEAIMMLYGTNPSPYPAREKEPFENADGTMTYYFQIDFKFAKDNIRFNSVKLEIASKKDTSNQANSSLWIIISALAVVLVGVVIIVIVVIRRRRNGGSYGGKSKGKQSKKSYKDYYV